MCILSVNPLRKNITCIHFGNRWDLLLQLCIIRKSLVGFQFSPETDGLGYGLLHDLVRVSVCFRVSVFLCNNSKSNRSMNTKF